jgi:hypothetical protein
LLRRPQTLLEAQITTARLRSSRPTPSSPVQQSSLDTILHSHPHLKLLHQLGSSITSISPLFLSPALSQVLYILMNGTGVGFSVEPIFVDQLPTVAERFVQTSSTVVVEDSREGWARALREIIALLYTGHVSDHGRPGLFAGSARVCTGGGVIAGLAPVLPQPSTGST